MKKISTFILFVTIGVNSSAQIVKENADNPVQSKVELQDINSKRTSSDKLAKPAVANKEVKVEQSKNKSTTISIRPGESQVTHDEAYFLNEITKIDNQISAIDQKIASVSNDPVEVANATNSGWFDDMERIKSELKAKKADIQNKLN